MMTPSPGNDPVLDGGMRELLGRWSSHPAALRRRSRISATLALGLSAWVTWKLVPLLAFHHAKGMISSLFPVGALERVMRSSSALPGVVRQVADTVVAGQSPHWAVGDVLLWFVLAALAGGVIAAGLSDRFASHWAASPDTKGHTGGETWGFPLALGMGLVFVLFAVPAAVFAFRLLPPRWELYADLLLLALLWTMLSWIGFSSRAGETRRWPLLALAGVLWAMPAYRLMSGFLSQGIGSLIFGTLGGVSLPLLALPTAVHWGLVAAGLVAFLAWRFWPRTRKAKEAADETVAEPPNLEAVVAEVLASLRTEHRVLTPLRAIAPAETSPLSSTPEFWSFFMGGMRPTTDQVAFLSKYQAGVKDFASRVDAEPFDTDWWNGFNMLLGGCPGSGRTTTLMATALYAATATGAVSLVIAPRADKARWLVSRIDALLTAVGMHTHFTCARLDEHVVHSVLEGTHGVPNVLVATPQDLEDCLFRLGKGAEPPSDPGKKDEADAVNARNQRLRLLVGSLQAVFVENLTEFAPVSRSHVVFQLEKLRLRLGAMGRSMTAVVVVPSMDMSAGAALGSRIFGEVGFRPDRDFVILRPAPFAAVCMSVELGAASPAELSEELAEALLRKDLSTVLLRSGIDEASCCEQKAKIAAAAGKGRLEVLGDLDQRYDGPRDVDAVVYQNLTTLDATVAIGIRFGGETVVVFHVRPTQTSMLVEPAALALPMFAGRESSSLVAYHALSFWSGLRPGENIEKEWMKRLIPERVDPAVVGARATPLADVRECRAAAGTAVRELMALERVAPAAFTPVSTSEIPDDEVALVETRAADGIRLSIVGRYPDEVASSTRLRWVSSAGQQIARWSVAHSPVLLLRAEEQTFAAASARASADGLDVTARFYQGKGDDLLLPIVDLSWRLPDAAEVRAEGGGADYGARWFRLVQADTKARSRVTVQGLFCGLVSEGGLATSQTGVPFTFDATCGLAVFNTGGDIMAFDPGGLARDWSTQTPTPHQHSKERTTALSAFLCEAFNGPAHFCWPVVFEDRGLAMVWLLEPVTTGSAVSEPLFRLLLDAAFRQRIGPVLSSTAATAGAHLLPPAPSIGSYPPRTTP